MRDVWDVTEINPCWTICLFRLVVPITDQSTCLCCFLCIRILITAFCEILLTYGLDIVKQTKVPLVTNMLFSITRFCCLIECSVEIWQLCFQMSNGHIAVESIRGGGAVTFLTTTALRPHATWDPSLMRVCGLTRPISGHFINLFVAKWEDYSNLAPPLQI